VLDTIFSSGGLKLSENVGTRNGTVSLILDPQWRVENEIKLENHLYYRVSLIMTYAPNRAC
jgi:hypothetical protein